MTVENSLMGQRFAGVPSNILQNSKVVGSPGIVTSLPWCGNFKHWWYVEGTALRVCIHGLPSKMLYGKSKSKT